MKTRPFLTLLLLLCSIPPPGFAGRDKADSTTRASSIATLNDYKAFTINQVFNYYANNGDGSYNIYTSNGAFEYPKGSKITAIFEDGIVWGGFHKGRSSPKVGGSVYRHALQPGRILVPGGPLEAQPAGADDPTKEIYRVYRVRPDVAPNTTFEEVRTALEQEAALMARDGLSIPAAGLYNDYIKDWNEWPGKGSATDSEGLAPFQDVNANGIYEPAVDIPGRIGADQTLYHVSNDLDGTLVEFLAGCPPIGLEVHRTIWGYDRLGAIGNTIFTSTVIINKSGAPVDSMFLVQWSDPDVGDAGDDFAGCDTSRDLGFCYNGRAADWMYGYNVPAVGYSLLQGPVVPSSPTDSALFMQQYRKGFTNQGMTTFVFFSSGWPQWADPVQGPGGDIDWYNLMNGLTRDGDPFINPLTNQPTKFCFDGDPATGTGWNDGLAGLTPQDRRICMVSGPFKFANGDTQEIVTATLIARAENRIGSVSLLKTYSDVIASTYRTLLKTTPPAVTAAVAYPASFDSVSITVRVDSRHAASDAVTATLKEQSGTPVADFPCYDNGSSGDLLAGDGIFSNLVTLTRREHPLDLDVMTTTGTDTVIWPRILSRITVAGLIELKDPVIFSDNLNSDGEINPGENVRYGVSVVNGTPFTAQLHLGSPFDAVTYDLATPWKTHVMEYDPDDPGSYMSVQIGSLYAGPTFAIPFTISDEKGNTWADTVTFDIVPITDTLKSALLTHVTGSAAGAFDILVVHQSQVKDHLYVIRGVDSVNAVGDPGITLVDSTDGRILLLSHPLPDSLGHNMPVTDGFKVLRGTVDHRFGYKTFEVPSGARGWTWVDANDLALEGFGGAIGSGSVSWPSGSTVGLRQLKSVLIRFAQADSSGSLVDYDTTISHAYRYVRNASLPPARPEFAPYISQLGPGLAYQDYHRNLPFAAYDITQQPERRLMVGYLENNASSGSVDGKYWPPRLNTGVSNTDSLGPREWFFVFNIPYGETPDPMLQTNLLESALPLLWWGTPTRRYDAFKYGDELIIRAFQVPTSRDVWTFNPKIVLAVAEAERSGSYALLQNYPNPFNPRTVVSSQYPAASWVTIAVFDLLGREVAVLVDERRAAGRYQDVFDGGRLASGVYFCRFEACRLERGERTARTFVQTMKMLLVK